MQVSQTQTGPAEASFLRRKLSKLGPKQKAPPINQTEPSGPLSVAFF
jgi:hypothetical protein